MGGMVNCDELVELMAMNFVEDRISGNLPLASDAFRNEYKMCAILFPIEAVDYNLAFAHVFAGFSF